jgi:subtilase family serine protease
MRNVLLLRSAAAVAVCLAVGGAVAATRAAQAAAGSAPQMSTVDACAPVPAPLAACFAKVRVDAAARTPAAAAVPTGYGPADLRSAYALPATGGAGRTVAIVDAFSSPSVEADLATYRSTFGLPACTSAGGCLRVVNQDGNASPSPGTDQGWGLEMSLDLDMVSATCPDCHILLVEANSNAVDDLGAAVDTAARLGAVAISNSYGSQEFAAQVQFEAHYDHPGHAVVASAGDSGYGPAYPASSAFVTAAGGTTLQRSGSGWAESVWSGTGSGCSAYIPKPAWQDDAHCPMRMMNDVAAVADPATGVAVYDTFGQSGWLVVGGTSASAPIIAALYALAGPATSVQDGQTPWRNRGAANFRDVTTGSNVPGVTAATCGGDYLCTGTTGYDGPTGWGTPQGLGGLTPAG